jgi:hypothetical protein
MNLIRTSRWAVLALVAAIAGCDTATTPTPAPNPTPAPAPAAKPGETKPSETKAADAKAEKPLDIAAAKLTDEEIAEVNKLEPAGDRKIALEQKLCPVSGDHLGSMETPIKVTLKGQTVFLCCGGCKKGAEAKPDETLAKLGK